MKNFLAYFTATNFAGDDTRLASLSTRIRLRVSDEKDNGLGEGAFDAIYSFSGATDRYADIPARQRAMNASVGLILSRFGAAPLIAYHAAKEMNYGNWQNG